MFCRLIDFSTMCLVYLLIFLLFCALPIFLALANVDSTMLACLGVTPTVLIWLLLFGTAREFGEFYPLKMPSDLSDVPLSRIWELLFVLRIYVLMISSMESPFILSKYSRTRSS